MANIGDDPANVLDISSDDDLSNVSSRTEIVDLKIPSVAFLEVNQPIANLINLNYSSGSGGVLSNMEANPCVPILAEIQMILSVLIGMNQELTYLLIHLHM